MGTKKDPANFLKFAALAELERESILERQREGIAIAKAQGKYKGRKPIPISDDFINIIADWQSGKLKLKDAIAKSGMSQSTFFRKYKECGIKKK